ncbi:MAG: zinc ribbon domain-containing protein [Haloarculaceae archaeon]
MDDDPGTGDDGTGPGERRPCPECGEPLPADARFCPHCVTPLSEAGDAVDLSELDADFDPPDPGELLKTDEAGNRRASGRVRVLAGLAVSIPVAPILLVLVSLAVRLTLPTAGLVFLGGWVLSAAILSRARVPAEAFGRSLYLIAVCTALLPVAVRVGGAERFDGPLPVSETTVAAASLVAAGAFVVVGTYVTRQARRRVTGERRAFEKYREE